jgi:hypothetical protein
LKTLFLIVAASLAIAFLVALAASLTLLA